MADTLGVARSSLVDQLRHPDRPPRGPYRRPEDEAVLAEIRAITDARPSCGYRRVTALLNRARRSSGEPPPNHKRIFRAFVKALKRDYARANPRPDAISVLQQLPAWLEDPNTIHPHSGSRMRSPRAFIAQQSANQAACPV